MFGEDSRSPSALLDTARRAEAAGYFVVMDRALDPVAPIVARIAGK